MNVRDRVKELRVVPAADLMPNPKNWREHPASQRKAMADVLTEVGCVTAAIAREMPDGKLMLIDGHLRHDLAEGSELPVLVLDVTEEEADKLLLTLDPIKEMADADAVALEELLHTFNTSSQALQELIAKTAKQAGIYEDLNEVIPAEADEPAPSGVRLVQLFLNESTVSKFQDACTKLAEVYGTENTTDTVLEAVRRASASL